MNPLSRVVCILSLCFIHTNIWAHNPSGVTANYALNPSIERSSALISSGQVKIKFGAFDPDSTQGPSYNTKYEYVFFIRYMGIKKGLGEQKIAEELFSQEFIENLRELGELETSQFKAKYLGLTTSSGPQGEQLDECDEILLTNFKDSSRLGFAQMVNSLLVNSLNTSLKFQPSLLSQIEELEVKLTTHPSLDGLGAARIDAAGFYNGIAVKMGLDLVAQ